MDSEPMVREGNTADLDPADKSSDFVKKILFYQELYKRAEELLGTKAIRVLTSVPTPGRRKALQALCRRVDPHTPPDKKEGRGLGIFWFTLNDEIQIDDPAHFFFDPIWHVPTLPRTGPPTLFDPQLKKLREEPAAPAALVAPSAVDLDMPDGPALGA